MYVIGIMTGLLNSIVVLQTMRMDHILNPMGWDKGKLRRKIRVMLERKTKMKRALLEGNEKLYAPLRVLLPRQHTQIQSFYILD